jgi:alpha-1,6-mannosyltransferase
MQRCGESMNGLRGAPSVSRPVAAWGLLALGSVACAALWCTGPAITDPTWARRFVCGYGVAWGCYLAASLLIGRATRLPKWVLLWVVAISLAARVVALERTPPLSTDVWRYLWDGRVANAGINPYLYPPNAPELRQLRDGNWKRINHKHIPTIYPPVAEMLFAGLARLRSRDAGLLKWSFLAFDMGTILLLMALLRRTGRPSERVIWYAWCPLPVTEVTAGEHVDAFGLFLLVLALLAATSAQDRTRLVGAIALAATILAKGFAVLTVPFLLRREGRRSGRSLVILVGACALMLAPFASAGLHLFGGLRVYLSHWKVNSSLFYLCDWSLARMQVANHYDITRHVSSIAIVAVVAWLTWRQRSGAESLVVTTFASLGALMLLGAPTLPWYVIWSLPLLCWRWVLAWALFSLTVSVQYYLRWLYPDSVNALLWAGYAPVYILLAGQVIWRRKHARRSTPSHTA